MNPASLSDAQRITRWPIEDLSSLHEELSAKWTERFRIHPNARPLRGVQAEFLENAARLAGSKPYMGAAGQLGVGVGKTLLLMLLPRIYKAKRPILLCPPDVVKQTYAAEHEWGQEYDIVRTVKDVADWKAGRGKFRLVMSYSQLSRPESTDLLTELQPDLIMADEAQALANSTAARTKRFLRFMKKNQATTRFVPLSGTLLGKSVMEMYHLFMWALRYRTPLPMDKHEARIWGTVYDVDGEPDNNAWRKVNYLTDWFLKNRDRHENVNFPQFEAGDDKELARLALGYRLKTMPGVVMTTMSSCSTKLTLSARYPTYADIGREHLGRLANDYVMPNDAAVDEASVMSENANQLSLGFYYVWDWPNGEPDEEWLEARRAWFGEVRRYLARWDEDGKDSPKLLEDWVRSGNGTAALEDALALWDSQRHKPEPPRLTRWFDYGPVLDAVQWASEHQETGGIIWFKSIAVGEMLEKFGLTVIRSGRVDHLRKTAPVICLPITVYHKGHDLNDWTHQLIMQPPPGGKVSEQLLGRLHRQGQPSDVQTDVFAHTWKLRQNVQRAVRDAKTIQLITFQPQKLLLAEGDLLEEDEWD